MPGPDRSRDDGNAEFVAEGVGGRGAAGADSGEGGVGGVGQTAGELMGDVAGAEDAPTYGLCHLRAPCWRAVMLLWSCRIDLCCGRPCEGSAAPTLRPGVVPTGSTERHIQWRPSMKPIGAATGPCDRSLRCAPSTGPTDPLRSRALSPAAMPRSRLPSGFIDGLLLSRWRHPVATPAGPDPSSDWPTLRRRYALARTAMLGLWQRHGIVDG